MRNRMANTRRAKHTDLATISRERAIASPGVREELSVLLGQLAQLCEHLLLEGRLLLRQRRHRALQLRQLHLHACSLRQPANKRAVYRRTV